MCIATNMESSAAAGDAESRVGEEGSTDQAPLSADGHKKKRRIAFSVAEKAMLVKRSRMELRPSQKEL